MSQSAINRVLEGHKAERNRTQLEWERWWAGQSHVEKAEWLIRKVDPQWVREADMPRLALAQVHATLALTDTQTLKE